MRVELRIEAREDLAEGAEFYDRQRPGLGDYFIESILADLEAIQSLGSTREFMKSSLGFIGSLPLGSHSRSTTSSLAH